MKLWRKYIRASVILVIIIILTVFLTLLILFCKKDRMEQYRVYVSESYVIVENRENPEQFYFAPRFLRYNGKLYFMNLWLFDHNVPESDYDYEYCELYYFENGHPQEAVFLMPENLDSEATEKGSISNNQEAERKLDITVKKRFVNDFINILEGY